MLGKHVVGTRTTDINNILGKKKIKNKRKVTDWKEKMVVFFFIFSSTHSSAKQ